MVQDPKAGPPRRNLPSLDVRPMELIQKVRQHVGEGEEKIPNASLVYGIASAVLLTMALYHLFTGAWFTALLVLVLAGALFGYALFFMREASGR